MDILLMDPPYTSLKGMSADIGYNIGLTSLAAYLRRGGVESGVLMGDLLMDLPSIDGWLVLSLKDYAAKQEDYRAVVNDETHPVWKRLSDSVRTYHPRAVGIAYLTPLRCTFERVASVIKSVDSDIKVIAGGPHPTFCPEDVMRNPNVDFVIRGEGEVPLLSLVRELKEDTPRWDRVPGIYYRDHDMVVHSNPRPGLLDDLNSMPFPARDLVLNCDFSVYRGHCALTARGCPYTCSFCADKSMWGGKVRRRSVENVIQELRQMKETSQVDLVDFQDGTFTYDRRYVESFCKAVIRERLDIKWRCTARYDNIDANLLVTMKEANCAGLLFGLESGSDRVLKAIDKKTNVEQIIKVNDMIYDSGIPSVTSVLFGLPDESAEDIEETLRIMRLIKTDMFDVNSYVPLPGSRITAGATDEEFRNIDWGRVGYKSYGNYFAKRVSYDRLKDYLTQAYEIADDARSKTILRYQRSIGLTSR